SGALQLVCESGMKGQRLAAVRHHRTVARARPFFPDQEEGPADLDLRRPGVTRSACGEQLTIDVRPVARTLVPDAEPPVRRQSKKGMVRGGVRIFDGDLEGAPAQLDALRTTEDPHRADALEPVSGGGGPRLIGREQPD